MADRAPRTGHHVPVVGGGGRPDGGAPDGYRRLEPEDLPGIHRIVVGAVVAVLAPLFGFLGGSVVGAEGGSSLQPLYYWLVGGIVVGGIGAIVAIMGGLRLIRSRNEQRADMAVIPDHGRGVRETGAEHGGTPAG